MNRTYPHRAKFALIFVLLAVFLLPASIALADDQPVPPYAPETIEPQTIPLWGPTWDHGDVTVIIKANNGVSQDAIDKVEQSVTDSNRAIHQRFGDDLFHLVLIEEGKADITIRPKAGGGSVAGMALQNSDDGIFNNCKINISGSGFGEPNSPDTVLSIALQELWHCLGLLHSDNDQDMMFGTLQDDPNIVISECDLDAFSEVMHWLLVDPADTDPHEPHETSVSCGDTGGGGSGNPPTGDLEVAGAIEPSGEFENRDLVHIFVTVEQHNSLINGAAVHVTLESPKSTLVGDFITDDEGQVHFHYTVNAGRDGKGVYVVLAEVSKDDASGDCNGPCATFTVN